MKLFRSSEMDITTTVGELILALQKLDPSRLVFTEGCDCYGNVVDVAVQPDGTILIRRDDRAVDFDLSAKEFLVSEHYRDRIEDK